jgi:small subunit ribosomal protein S18
MLRGLLRPFSFKNVLANEFYTNPHFERAFPHLSNPLYKDREDDFDYETIKQGIIEDSSNSERKGKDKDPTFWADSLLNKTRVTPERTIDYETFDQRTFVDGYRTPRGPLKWMSPEDKAQVHNQASMKLQELEDTGLSRDEILYRQPGGIPLAEDPVFQFIKNNHDAREMMMQPGQELTMENIVDAALCSKVDIDRAKVLPDREYLYEHELPDDYLFQVNQGADPDKVHPRDYYWAEDLKGKFDEFKRYRASPGALFPEAINRRAVRRKNFRTLPVEDISYKNVELLTQFMTEAGKIKNKWQTRLPGRLQIKVAKAIKQARDLNLLPHAGMITDLHKRNLVPWFIEDVNKVVIHSETGQLYARREAQDAKMPQKPPTFREQSLLEAVYEDADVLASRSNSLSFSIHTEGRLNKDSVTIAEARDHMRVKRRATKESYESVVPKVAHVAADDIAATYIKENSLDPSLLQAEKFTAKQGNVEEIWAELVSFKRKLGLRVETDVPSYVEELIRPKVLTPFKTGEAVGE